MNFIKVILAVLVSVQPVLVHAQVLSRTKSNKIQFGDGSNTNKVLEFKKGESQNPEIRYNSTESVLEFTNDGTNYAEIGSGSGGGSGGINLLKKGGFESGLTGWTNSGGTFGTVDPSSPLHILGKKTGSFQASAAGQYVDTELMDIPPALRGKLCAFRGLYTGPAGDNLKIQVLDETSNLVESFVEKTLPSSDGADVPEFMQTFTCPVTGKIKGRILSTAAAGPVGLDEFHLGEAVKLYTYGGKDIGDVFFTSADSCPIGSEDANGDAVLISKYPQAYNKIGIKHGNGTTNGNGSSSGYAVGVAFNKADARDRFLRGASLGANRDPDRASRTAQNVGGATGNNIGTVQGHAFQTHTHVQNSHSHKLYKSENANQNLGAPGNLTSGTYVASSNGYGSISVNYAAMAASGAPDVGLSEYHTATNQNAGATGANSQASTGETRPQNLSLRACQQLVGETVPVLQTGEAAQYAGTIYAWSGPMCPGTDLPADGRAALRSEFPDMWSNLGTAWGDGTKTPTGAASGISAGLGFNFPDARGFVLRGVDGSAGRDPDKASRTALISGGGGNTGNAVGSYQADALQNITGSVSVGTGFGTASQSRTGAFTITEGAQTNSLTAGSSNTRLLGFSFDASAVARTSTETRSKNVNVLYCVTTRTAKLGAVVPYGVVSRDMPGRTVVNTINQVSSNYTATLNEETIVATAGVTITLPDAALSKGKKFHIVQSGNFTSIITSPNTICGNSTIRITHDKDSVTLQSDGSKWIGLEGSCKLNFAGMYHGASYGTNCTSSPCSLSHVIGVTPTITRTSTGGYNVTVASGVSSSSFMCSVNGELASNQVTVMPGGSGFSATNFSFKTGQVGGSLADTWGIYNCVGYR